MVLVEDQSMRISEDEDLRCTTKAVNRKGPGSRKGFIKSTS
jgi:hypothetical protein